MRTTTSTIGTIAAAAALSATLMLGTAWAEETEPSAQETYRDIERTLGSVPNMFKAFPKQGIAGAWREFKTFQLNPDTALSNKTKELIGLAVAAQVPCDYCVYFHTQAATANGASKAEIREAVAMAAMTRHWSTVLNGMHIDLQAFKQETDAVLRAAEQKEVD